MKQLMLKIWIGLLILFLFHGLKAHEIDINLFNDYSVRTCVFSVYEGEFSLIANDKQLVTLSGDEIIYVSILANQVQVNGKNRLYGRFDSVRFDANGNNSVFQLRPVSPSINSRRYEGDLFIDIDFNRLHLINRVEFNNYLAGVVETESGAYAQMEFYKAQALLCRTYALKNTNRHIEEGFNLCDGTHCQAYKSMNMHNPDIKRAVN
jgi:stage II sporulation protein D